MKPIKGFMIILSLFAIVSCTTTENTAASAVEEEVIVEDTSSEKKMVEVEVEEIFYFVTREEAFYGDGQVDTITDYTYNEDFNVLSYIQSNEQKEVLESLYNTIESGKVVRRDNYGFGNILNTYIIFTYNSDGMIESDSLFNREEKIQSINEYEYKDGNIVLWRTLGPNGGALAITAYEYDSENNNTKVEMKDATGVIDGVIEKVYQDSLLIEEKVFDSKGKIEKSTQYVYENETLVEVAYFDKRGKKKRSETFDFEDSLPVPNKINLLYSSGALEAYRVLTYDSKVVKSTIWVEE